MKAKPLILIAVLINIAFVSWLLLRSPNSETEDISNVVEDLVSTETMEKTKFGFIEKLWSQKYGFPKVSGGPGGFKKAREAERNKNPPNFVKNAPEGPEL